MMVMFVGGDGGFTIMCGSLCMAKHWFPLLFRFTPDWCGVTDGVMWSGDLVMVARGFTGDWLVVDWSTQCLVGHLVVYRRKARYILCDSNAVPEGMG